MVDKNLTGIFQTLESYVSGWGNPSTSIFRWAGQTYRRSSCRHKSQSLPLTRCNGFKKWMGKRSYSIYSIRHEYAYQCKVLFRVSFRRQTKKGDIIVPEVFASHSVLLNTHITLRVDKGEEADPHTSKFSDRCRGRNQRPGRHSQLCYTYSTSALGPM